MNTTQRDERRQYPRLELGATVPMVFGGRGATGTLTNISVVGVQIRSTVTPLIGQRVVLHVNGLGRYVAEVRRVDSGSVALTFVTETREQWNLVKKLARLLA